MSGESAELLNILSKFELDGLCHAFDTVHHSRRLLGEFHLQQQQQQYLPGQNPFTSGAHHIDGESRHAADRLLTMSRTLAGRTAGRCQATVRASQLLCSTGT